SGTNGMTRSLLSMAFSACNWLVTASRRRENAPIRTASKYARRRCLDQPGKRLSSSIVSTSEKAPDRMRCQDATLPFLRLKNLCGCASL
ncbi:MAG TPA: hypothetical protein VN289_24150, partial [Paraburkholderia sp.]|nr:hypothetical protein [Paraburkholderia sp.]